MPKCSRCLINMYGIFCFSVFLFFCFSVFLFFLFFLFFFGAGAISFLATAINYKHIKHSSFWLIAVAALVYILGVIVFTAQVNLPLNYYAESWNPAELPNDWGMVRASWNQANAIRVVTSFVPFLLSIIALCTRCTSRS
jgi:uncharacterized membrane protein